jgi:flagellin
MPTVINTNLASLFAQNSLSSAQNNLATSVQRLSSGLRINSAKDDAAGLSISQNMQSQINGTNQSIRNLSDATNLLQVSDSSLSTVQDMLLRLKQLATQGYDGSLNGAQRLNLVQEMKELNNEINTTAARTEFNGIKLLSQGGSTDQVNSDIKAGINLVTTAVTARGSSGAGVANAGILVDGATATLAASTTLTVVLDEAVSNKLPGTYTFGAVGDQLTINGTVEGVQTAQTLTVLPAPADQVAGRVTPQSLNFDRFGITLNLTTTAGVNTPITGAAIAAAVVAEGAGQSPGTLTVLGNVSQITSTSVTGAAAGTYRMQAAGAVVTMSGSVNGQPITQAVTLAAGVANTTQNVNFSAFGISFDIRSYQAHADTAIATALVALNGGTGPNTGEFIVSQGANSALKFQSGANSDAFIQINTRNIQTASTGAYAGTATEMLTLGTRITSSAAGNLGALTKDSSIDVWQTAFKNAAAAVDNALEYISTERSVYGAQTNRLSYISNNLQAQSTNLQNSRSAIIDTDFAAETAKLTKGQIMQQAATAMLAQANQMPNVILSLLK